MVEFWPGAGQDAAKYRDDGEHVFHGEHVLVVHRQHHEHAQHARRQERYVSTAIKSKWYTYM